MNKAILIGRLGTDPELKFVGDGSKALLRFRLATSKTWRDKQSGDKQERTEWHTVCVWGKRAEGLNKVLEKGARIGVEGELRTREWEAQDGGKRTATEIHVDFGGDVHLLGGGSRDSGQRQQQSGGYSGGPGPDEYGGDFGDDDIPF